MNTFVDEHTHLLAWAILFLIPFNWWRLPAARTATLTLSTACLGTMLFISLVIACLMKAIDANEFATLMVARYFYPLLIAWFIGLLLPWLMAPAESNTAAERLRRG